MRSVPFLSPAVKENTRQPRCREMMGVRGALVGTVPGAQDAHFPPSGLPGEASPLSHGEQSLGWLGAPSQCLTAGRSRSSAPPSSCHPGAPCCLGWVLTQCYKTGKALETKQIQERIHSQLLSKALPTSLPGSTHVPACMCARVHARTHTRTHTHTRNAHLSPKIFTKGIMCFIKYFKCLRQ